MSLTFGIAVLGAITGVVGTILGIINTWKQFDRDKVKLRVVPKVYSRNEIVGLITTAELRDGQHPFSKAMNRTDEVCIEVTNLSTFPVTVREIGFFLSDSDERYALMHPFFVDQKPLPRRMEPRTTFVAFAPPNDESKMHFHRLKSAYASTDCGVIFRGKSNALTALVNRFRKKDRSRNEAAEVQT